MTAPDRVFYWGSGSGPCWRVQIVMEEKGLKYESKLVEFSKREHKSPEIMALNPRGQVPVLRDGDIVVCESMAAMQYLEDFYPEPCLQPKDQAERALMLQRFHEVNVLAVKVGAPFQIKMRIAMGLRPDTPEAAKECEEKLAELKPELELWEQYTAKGWLTGGDFSLADAAVIPLLLLLLRGGASLEAFPNLKAYVEKAKERPSVVASWPPHWKSSPNMTFLEGVL